MAVTSIRNDGALPWRLWNPEPGPGFSANFYTPTKPYLRKRMTVTHLSLAPEAEKAARDEGFVTLPELPRHVIEHWAESDANWLVDQIVTRSTAEEI